MPHELELKAGQQPELSQLPDKNESHDPLLLLEVIDPSSAESKKLVPLKDTWEVACRQYKPELQAYREAVFSLSNGYMSSRSSLEEANGALIFSASEGKTKRVHTGANYINGLFEQEPPDPLEGISEGSRMPQGVNIPNWLPIEFGNDTDQLNIDTAILLDYQQTLDTHSGIITRKFKWVGRDGKATNIEITRFLSRDKPHLGVIRYTIIPEYDGEVTFRAGIDGGVDNNGTKLLEEIRKGQFNDGAVYYEAKTKYKGDRIGLSSKVAVSSDSKDLLPQIQAKQSDETVFHEVKFPVAAGKRYSLDKIVSIRSSHDKDTRDPITQTKGDLEKYGDFEKLLQDQKEAWKRIWEVADIEVSGDDLMQWAVRFNRYEAAQMVWSGDDRYTLPPKEGDIPGVGYSRHGFWDAELYMLPPLVNTNPDSVRSYLTFRYHNLEGAREKARENGYGGAWYAWETAGEDGREATPSYIKDKRINKLTEIFTHKREYHISADVAHAVWQYYLATGDQKFIKEYGSEILWETARFWVSKVRKDSEGSPDGLYHIKNAIGPDEYHEQVDDNFYTNVMAQENIKNAIKVWNMFKDNHPEVAARINLSDEEVQEWGRVAERIYLPYDEEHQLYEQFSGFFDLEPLDFRSRFPGKRSIDSELKLQGEDPSKYQVIKQSDVLLALLNLGVADKDVWQNEFNYYEPKTCHGSSLSPAMHVIFALKAGYPEKAWEYFRQAVAMDLEDVQGNTYVGTHTASIGGLQRAVIEGFGGVEVKEEDRDSENHPYLSINPSLPDHWNSMKFHYIFQGQTLECRIDHHVIVLESVLASEARSSAPITVKVGNNVYNVTAGNRYTFNYSKESEDQKAA